MLFTVTIDVSRVPASVILPLTLNKLRIKLTRAITKHKNIIVTIGPCFFIYWVDW